MQEIDLIMTNEYFYFINFGGSVDDDIQDVKEADLSFKEF
jgi:hypothetical protein